MDLLKANNHNFIRLWKIGENTVKGDGIITPMPWERTIPELSNDGKPKFDLTLFNQAYFERLRSRVIKAADRGIYVSIMLFEGIYEWTTHPFNPANNVNGNDGGEADFFTLNILEVNQLQKEYVSRVIDTANDLDNVLYEMGNEIRRNSVEWQYHIINYIHNYEKTKPKQHPVGMTSTGGNKADDLTNHDLLNSPADWIYPRSSEPAQNYSCNPPPSTGPKVIISDTDHIWGVLGDPTAEWVWKSFLIGTRIFNQHRHDKKKIYSVHEPHVECISKGRAHKRYEIGCKVSVAATSRGGWFVGAMATHGNPYDGHTLKNVLEQVQRVAGDPEHAFVDMDYGGHEYSGAVEVHVDKRHRGRTAKSVWLWMKRRAAIEPGIGGLI